MTRQPITSPPYNRAPLMIALLLSFVWGGVACQSSPDPVETTKTADQPDQEAAATAEPAPTTLRAEQLIGVTEALRDRAFETAPALQSVSRASLSVPEAPGAWAGSSQQALAQIGLDAEGVEAVPKRLTLAAYDAKAHTIRYAARHDDGDLVEVAVVMALVDALNAPHSTSETSSGASLDAHIAGRCVRDGAATWVAALYEIKHLEGRTLPEQSRLARTPDHVWRAASRVRQLTSSGSSWADQVSAYTHREGMVMISALLRAQGWNGVEYALSAPPQLSASAIAPSRWMNGEGAARMEWPAAMEKSWAEQGWGEVRRGRFGAALIASWLATHGVPEQAVRVLPASYLAGMWRHWSRQKEERFVWVTQWEAPTAAESVAQVITRALTSVYPSRDASTQRWAVLSQGLRVAVIITNTARPTSELDKYASVAAETTAIFEGRAGPPIPYVPSIAEALMQGATTQTLTEEGAWRDASLGLTADTATLADWEVSPGQQGLVRWWARREGATIQLTAEPADPLGPSFGSEEYQATFSEAITSSLQDAEVRTLERAEHPALGSVLHMRVDGRLQHRLSQIALWAWARHGAIVTLSMTAPSERADEAYASAKKVFASCAVMEGTAPAEEDASEEQEGIIQFEVESD